MMQKKQGWQMLLSVIGIGAFCVPAMAQQSVVVPANAPQAPTGIYDSVVSGGGCSSCQSAAPTCGCQSAAPKGESRCGGDPWTLFARNCDEPKYNIGGWFQMGTHGQSNGLFNSQPDDLNLHQAWLFVEKEAVSRNGNLGFGFRFDGMYGIDANDTQAFGNTGATWDRDPAFTRGGGYGWAIPQLYGEVAMGDWKVKAGHFYTLIGYETVTAPDNFFYSHAMTMYNSEPFTHTGILASKALNPNTTVYGGWTAGWDSGFDLDAGSNFLGGFSTNFNDDVSLAYMTTFGDFGVRSAGNQGYSHSIVLDMQMTENLNTVVQSDMTRIEGTGEDSFGLMLYNFYKINDCLSIGSRSEWWKGDDTIGYDFGGQSLAPVSSTSYFATTYGLNYKVNPNITLRPEYRRDWSPALDHEEDYFGIDVVATF